MMITRLTIHPLLYFGLTYQFIRVIPIRLYRYHDYGVRCDFWAGSGSETRHHLVIDDRTAGFIRIADRDSIIERHEEGVGIAVEKGRCV